MNEHEVNVYARRLARIAIADITAGLRARGHSAGWHPRIAFANNDPSEWTSGYFKPPDPSHLEVSLSNEPLDAPEREDLLEFYEHALTDRQRQHMAQAVARYKAVATGDPSDERARLLADVVDIVAKLSDALIYDVRAERFYDADAWAAQKRGRRGS